METFKFNSINGTLFKSYQKTFFVRFHLQSDMAKYILNDNSCYKGKPVIVQQIMLCGDMEVLVELIYKNDYDEMINSQNKWTGIEPI